MKNKLDYIHKAKYIYRYSCHDQERELCNMEARQWFDQTLTWYHSNAIITSNQPIDVDRSPYMKYKLDVWKEACSFEQLLAQLTTVSVEQSFKVEVLEQVEHNQFIKTTSSQRRAWEQQLGACIIGHAELDNPQLILGVVIIDNSWYFGLTKKHKGYWQLRIKKPRQYSTALGTSVARAVVNIAVPNLESHIKLVDPCCGIGTVLLEACDLGIDVEGYDINPLAVTGARENISAYHYQCHVTIQDMRLLTCKYDVAILDLPYNHCSVLTSDERLEMLDALSKLCKRAVVVSVEPIENELVQIGAKIVDKGNVRKTHFNRDIWLVEFNT